MASEDIQAQEAARTKRLRGILSVIGGSCIFMVIGSVYLFGSISPYILAYFNETEKRVTDKYTLPDAMVFMPIRGLTLLFFMSGGGYFYSKGLSIKKYPISSHRSRISMIGAGIFSLCLTIFCIFPYYHVFIFFWALGYGAICFSVGARLDDLVAGPGSHMQLQALPERQRYCDRDPAVLLRDRDLPLILHLPEDGQPER
jgi:hypothetical protein